MNAEQEAMNAKHKAELAHGGVCEECGGTDANVPCNYLEYQAYCVESVRWHQNRLAEEEDYLRHQYGKEET